MTNLRELTPKHSGVNVGQLAHALVLAAVLLSGSIAAEEPTELFSPFISGVCLRFRMGDAKRIRTSHSSVDSSNSSDSRSRSSADATAEMERHPRKKRKPAIHELRILRCTDTFSHSRNGGRPAGRVCNSSSLDRVSRGDRQRRISAPRSLILLRQLVDNVM